MESGDIVPRGAGEAGEALPERRAGGEFRGQIVIEIEPLAEKLADQRGWSGIDGIGRVHPVVEERALHDAQLVPQRRLAEEVVIVIEVIGLEGVAGEHAAPCDDVA